jgi:hypothetical protein
MRLIGIRFSDNDYGNLFRGLLFTLMAALEWRATEPNREQLLQIINENIYGMYFMWQHKYRFDETPSREEVETHLEITDNKLYIDEQVDQFFNEKGDWHNSEFIYVDLKTKELIYV